MDEEQWIAGYAARVATVQDRAETAAGRLAGVAATTSSPDGAVTLTVDAAGALQRLVLGPSAASLPLPRLADTVLNTARRARAHAAREALAAVAPLLADRPDALQLLQAQLDPEVLGAAAGEEPR